MNINDLAMAAVGTIDVALGFSAGYFWRMSKPTPTVSINFTQRVGDTSLSIDVKAKDPATAVAALRGSRRIGEEIAAPHDI